VLKRPASAPLRATHSAPLRSLPILPVQGLIVSHFMGQCSWCRELSPAGTGSDASKVGRIEAVEPVSGATVPFFVFVQDKRWTISMQSPAGNTAGVLLYRALYMVLL